MKYFLFALFSCELEKGITNNDNTSSYSYELILSIISKESSITYSIDDSYRNDLVLDLYKEEYGFFVKTNILNLTSKNDIWSIEHTWNSEGIIVDMNEVNNILYLIPKIMDFVIEIKNTNNNEYVLNLFDKRFFVNNEFLYYRDNIKSFENIRFRKWNGLNNFYRLMNRYELSRRNIFDENCEIVFIDCYADNVDILCGDYLVNNKKHTNKKPTLCMGNSFVGGIGIE